MKQKKAKETVKPLVCKKCPCKLISLYKGRFVCSSCRETITED